MGLREEKKEAARRDIREAAWRLFEERGYDAVSVEEIAAAAGVSRTTFFNYFRTKEGVVLDPSPEESARLAALVAEQPPSLPAWDAVTAVLLGLSRAGVAEIGRRRRLGGPDAALERRAQELGEELAEMLRAWLRERDPEDPLGAALTVDVALAATRTAWSAWPPGSDVDTYLALLEECLARARPERPVSPQGATAPG